MNLFLKIWGLPWKRVWYVRGLPWKFVWNFGSCHHFKSDLLRLWSRMSESCHTKTNHPCLVWVVHTGWRRCIGCLKLQVSFCKRATNFRALLYKMTYKDKASYISTPPCISHVTRLIFTSFQITPQNSQYWCPTSCHIWVSHVTYARHTRVNYIQYGLVMSHLESRKGQVTQEKFKLHKKSSCHTRNVQVTQEKFQPHKKSSSHTRARTFLTCEWPRVQHNSESKTRDFLPTRK